MTKQKPSYFMGINLRKLRKQYLAKQLIGECRNHWYDNILGNLLAAECPGDRYDTPTESCFNSLSELLRDPDYWESWVVSFQRVFTGFIVAQIIGIPIGLIMGINRHFGSSAFHNRNTKADSTTRLVPTAVIFWPTPEMSITFVTFLGAFFTMVLNILGA